MDEFGRACRLCNKEPREKQTQGGAHANSLHVHQQQRPEEEHFTGKGKTQRICTDSTADPDVQIHTSALQKGFVCGINGPQFDRD